MAGGCVPTVGDGAGRPRPLRAVAAAPLPYEDYFQMVEGTVRRVARRMRLNAAESDDLFSDLWLRLLADDGLALRRLRHQTRLAKYLAAVARNLVLDVRNKHWGKWRPTATARHSGATAIRLERLLECDGLTFDEAVEWFAVAEPGITAQQLRRLAVGIARRPGRRQVAVDVLESFAASEPTPYESVSRGESARRSRMLRRALERAVATLSEGNRSLLRWRYLENRTVPEIAAILDTEPKPLYRRFKRLLSQLRAALEADGFDAAKVIETLSADAEGVQFTMPGPSLPPVIPLQRSA